MFDIEPSRRLEIAELSAISGEVSSLYDSIIQRKAYRDGTSYEQAKETLRITKINRIRREKRISFKNAVEMVDSVGIGHWVGKNVLEDRGVYKPTHKEIAKGCQEAQKTWSVEERERRAGVYKRLPVFVQECEGPYDLPRSLTDPT